MTTKDSSHDSGSERMRSPLTQAAILLGIYIGMYLAVAGVIRVLPLLGAAKVMTSSN